MLERVGKRRVHADPQWEASGELAQRLFELRFTGTQENKLRVEQPQRL